MEFSIDPIGPIAEHDMSNITPGNRINRINRTNHLIR